MKYNKNYPLFLLLSIWGCVIAVFIIYSSVVKAQERFLLTEAEMPGYELIRQSKVHWGVGEEFKIHYGIGQKWHITGGDKRDNIDIEYCEFRSEIEAIKGTAYASHTFAGPFISGSHTGAILGDGTWIAISGGSIFFVRGNIGIKINIRVHYDESDVQALMLLSNKLLHKIESNLSPDVLALEAAARQQQIPLKDYQTITDPVVNSETMSGFSLHTTWDSKWLMNSESLAMGIRKEWKNEQSSIVGIDICQFESDLSALNASEIQAKIAYSAVFNLNNLDALQAILTEWQQKWTIVGGLPTKKLFSVIGIKENLLVHVYFFNPAGIDPNFVYALVKQLSGQILNF